MDGCAIFRVGVSMAVSGRGQAVGADRGVGSRGVPRAFTAEDALPSEWLNGKVRQRLSWLRRSVGRRSRVFAAAVRPAPSRVARRRRQRRSGRGRYRPRRRNHPPAPSVWTTGGATPGRPVTRTMAAVQRRQGAFALQVVGWVSGGCVSVIFSAGFTATRTDKELPDG